MTEYTIPRHAGLKVSEHCHCLCTKCNAVLDFKVLDNSSTRTQQVASHCSCAGQATAGTQVCIEYACLGEVHQASTKALDLLIGSDGTEGNFPKALLMEGPVRDATHNILFSPHNCN